MVVYPDMHDPHASKMYTPLLDAPQLQTCMYAEEPSLFLFGPQHPVRQLCTAIARNSYFRRLSLALVCLTCVLLAVEDPHATHRGRVFASIELLTLAYFTFEAAVEIIEHTFMVYVRQWSHVLDLVVICNTLIAMLADASANAEVRTSSVPVAALACMPLPMSKFEV